MGKPFADVRVPGAGKPFAGVRVPAWWGIRSRTFVFPARWGNRSRTWWSGRSCGAVDRAGDRGSGSKDGVRERFPHHARRCRALSLRPPRFGRDPQPYRLRIHHLRHRRRHRPGFLTIVPCHRGSIVWKPGRNRRPGTDTRSPAAHGSVPTSRHAARREERVATAFDGLPCCGWSALGDQTPQRGGRFAAMHLAATGRRVAAGARGTCW